jgi:hypothetical protein
MPQGRNAPKRESKKPKKTEAKKVVAPGAIVTSEGVEVIGKRRKRKEEDF